MKKILVLLMLVASAVLFSGCNLWDTRDNSDLKQSQATEQLMQEANRQIGMPNITNFSQKKMIQEECDKADLICYAYLKSDYTGKLVFIGKCIGYGVPYSAQFTNPMKVDYPSSAGRIAIPQADPNGLFMPASANATWLMLIDPKTGKPKPAFFEPEVVILPFMIEE